MLSAEAHSRDDPCRRPIVPPAPVGRCGRHQCRRTPTRGCGRDPVSPVPPGPRSARLDTGRPGNARRPGSGRGYRPAAAAGVVSGTARQAASATGAPARQRLRFDHPARGASGRRHAQCALPPAPETALRRRLWTTAAAPVTRRGTRVSIARNTGSSCAFALESSLLSVDSQAIPPPDHRPVPSPDRRGRRPANALQSAARPRLRYAASMFEECP
jgi:hypothetical protein